MDYLLEISAALQSGQSKRIRQLVPEALETGIQPDDILNKGLLRGMSVVGEKFRRDEVFVPEVLIAAHSIKLSLAYLQPYLQQEDRIIGTVILGTVQGDLHDIGKNMVRMMMECAGLRVIDLGVDVPAERFISTAIQESADIIACSALLTTTMPAIKTIVEQAKLAKIRDKVKIMVGGAPTSQAFCSTIGADIYTPDAASAAETAVALLK